MLFLFLHNKSPTCPNLQTVILVENSSACRPLFANVTMGRVLGFPQVDELVGVLNASNITSTTEVVVAPPSVYLHGVSQKLRGDVKVRKPAWVVSGVFARCACSQISGVEKLPLFDVAIQKIPRALPFVK